MSSFQLDLTAHDLSGLSFCLTKATDGLSGTDPHFGHNWPLIKAAGLHRGCYHELQAPMPAAQAVHFLATVQAAGLAPGDMLAVVASDYPGVTDEDVLLFCEAVKAATGGLNPVEVYTDLSVGATLTRCSAAGYGLWVAHPSATAPPMPLASWRSWRLWQSGTRTIAGLGRVDADEYDGTPAQMAAWLATYTPKPPAPHLGEAAFQSGDAMLYLPNGAGATVAIPVPAAVASPAGPVAPSVLRFSAPGVADLEYEHGLQSGVWVPFTVDAARSAQVLELASVLGHGQTAIKVRRPDASVTLVLADFA